MKKLSTVLPLAVKQIASGTLTQPNSIRAKATCSENPSLSMQRLWRRMGMIYGYRWSRQFGVEDDGTWAAGLSRLSEQKIFTGIEACIDRANDWPPTLPEFRGLCLKKDTRENAAMYRERPARLEYKLTDGQKAEGSQQARKLIDRVKAGKGPTYAIR